MSKTQYYCAASLDGFIAEADDSLAWLVNYRGSFEGDAVEAGPRGEGGAYEQFYDGVGALISGATTYEFVLAHLGEDGEWPYAGKPWWVLSSRDLPLPKVGAVDVRIVNTRVANLYDEMIATAGERNVWVLGGGDVASQFADEGLLDEVLVTVVPVVLGTGKPLFERRLPGGAMQLMGARAFHTGMVELRYELKR